MESENLNKTQNFDRYQVHFCYFEETPNRKLGWHNLGGFKSYYDIAKATGINAETCKAIANNRCKKCYPQIKIAKLPWKELKQNEIMARKNAIANRIAANKAKRAPKKKMIVPVEAVTICDPLPQ